MTEGQIAYEDYLAAHPVYHDGTPRKMWQELNTAAQREWNSHPQRISFEQSDS